MTETMNEPRAWTLSNTILTALGALILLLLSAGFWSLNSKIESGDLSINRRLDELCAQNTRVSEIITGIVKDVARIDALQKQRIEKEARDEMRRFDYPNNGLKK